MEKDCLLLELLSNGRGSLDYAKNLIAGDTGQPGPEGPPESELPEWCLCGLWGMQTYANTRRKQMLWKTHMCDLL